MNILIRTIISSSLYESGLFPAINVAVFLTEVPRIASRKQNLYVRHADSAGRRRDDIPSRICAAGVSRIVLQPYLASGAAVPGDSDSFLLNQVTELVVKG